MNDPRDQTTPQDPGESPDIPEDDPEQTLAQPETDSPDHAMTEITAVSGQFDAPGLVIAEFDQQIRHGGAPAIEDYLRRVDSAFHEELFPLLLRREFESRMAGGEPLALREWRERFPQFALQIALTHKAIVAEQSATQSGTNATGTAVSQADSQDDATIGDPDDEETIDETTGDEHTDFASRLRQRAAPGLAAQRPVASKLADGGADDLVVEGRYEKRTVLGAGGMGAIWTAFDARTRRTVAFKEIRTNKLTNQQYVARFLNEAQITAQLEHPGIVPVHDVGWQADGAPYYVMRLVSDETLSRRMREFHKLEVGHADRNLASTRLLRDFINVCYSLDYAHARGIIHRDLKPDNVMIGQHGETMIIDWGLARPFRRGKAGESIASTSSEPTVPKSGEGLNVPAGESVDLESIAPDKTPTLTASPSDEGDTDQFDQIEREHVTPTIDGAVMGTLDYMAPEQAQGRLDSLDHRADIFALGAILFQILTGETWPRGKMKTAEKIAYVAKGEVPPACEINSAVPRQLDAICTRAMAPEMGDRYSTARELIDDIECWLADKPVSVYADPWTTRCRRWMQKNRTAVSVSAATVLVVGVSTLAWNFVEIRRIATAEADAFTNYEDADEALADHDFETAQNELREAIGIIGSEPSLKELSPIFQSMAHKVDVMHDEDARVHELQKRAEALVLRHSDTPTDPDARKRAAQELALVTDEVETAMNRFERERFLAEDAWRKAMDHWIASLQPELDQLNEAQRTNNLITQTVETLREFQSELDSVRYYGMRFPGSGSDDQQSTGPIDVLRNLLTGYDYELVGGEQPATRKLIADLDAVGNLPEPDRTVFSLVRFLDEDRRQELKDGLFELLVRISDVESTRSSEEALDWLEVAELLRSPSRPVLERRLTLLSGSGDDTLRPVELALREAPPATVAELCLLGETAVLKLDWETAERFYRAALEVDSGHFQARYLAAWCAWNSRRPGTALEDLSVCIEQRPKFAGAYIARSLARLDLREFDAALEDTNQAFDIDSDLYLAWMARGNILAEKTPHSEETWNESIAAFTRAADLRPDYPLPLISRGETRRQMAIAILGLRDPSLQNHAAKLLLSATDDFSSAIELSPKSSRAYLFRGQTRATLGQTDRASEDLAEGIRLGGRPDFIVACYREIGRVQMQTQQYTAALWSFNRALELSPQDRDLTLLKGNALRRLGEDEEFVEFISRYLEVGQPVSDLFWNRGKSQHTLGMLREAVQDYTRLLDGGGETFRTEVLNRRGRMYLMHAYEFAEADFDEAIKRQPDNADNYTGRGYARVQLGDYEAAIADAELAVERARPDQADKHRVWVHYFNAATIYGQAFIKAGLDSSLSEAEQMERQATYVTEVAQLLDKAREVAPTEFHGRVLDFIKNESAFDAVRDSEEFKAAVQRFAPEQPAERD